MKLRQQHLIAAVVVIGILTLYFFPEPETNFLAYFITAVIFAAVAILIAKKFKRQDQSKK